MVRLPGRLLLGIGLTLSLAPTGRGIPAVTTRATGPPVAQVLARLLPSASGRAGVATVAFSPDGRTVVTGGDDRLLHLWDVATGRELRCLAGHDRPITSAAFSPDGRLLVSGGDDPVLRVWDVTRGQELRQLKGHQGGVAGVVFAPRGSLVASAGNDGTARLWDPATGQQVRQFEKQACRIAAVAFSPDGKRLATANYLSGAAPAIGLWDVASAAKVQRLGSDLQGVNALAFSPDGRLLAAGNLTRITLWDVETGRSVRQLHGPTGYLKALAFSPDGRLLAAASAGSAEQSLCLWDVVSAKEWYRLQDAEDFRVCVAFAPDGWTLAAGGNATPAVLWDLSGGWRWRSAAARLLSGPELEAAWQDLADPDPSRAYHAFWVLVAARRQAVDLCRQHLRPITAADRARIARWVTDLDDDRFVVRENATAELARLGDLAEGALRQAVAQPPSREVLRRAEALLGSLGRRLLDPQQMRAVRAVGVLEQIGTPEARQLLAALADGAPRIWLTEQAQAALARLAKRPARP